MERPGKRRIENPVDPSPVIGFKNPLQIVFIERDPQWCYQGSYLIDIDIETGPFVDLYKIGPDSQEGFDR